MNEIQGPPEMLHSCASRVLSHHVESEAIDTDYRYDYSQSRHRDSITRRITHAAGAMAEVPP